MKIALVQCRSQIDALDHNVARHVSMLQRLESYGVELVAFPELSLCHYEPVTASLSPISSQWAPLDAIQGMAEVLNATVVVGGAVDLGLPRPIIASLIFCADQPMRIMGKRHLHEDEVPYFSPFPGDVTILERTRRVGLAVCYELSIAAHIEALVQSNVSLCLACVAKTATGMLKATHHMKQIARQHALPTLLVNGLGDYEGTPSGGGTSVIDATGDCLAQLPADEEGVLIVDTASWRTEVVCHLV